MTTELENLLAVFRAIDDGLAAHPQRTAAVAELLPPYEGGAATGWVATVERWAAARPGATEPVHLPEVEAALATLAEDAPPPGGEARRVLTLCALARAQPDRFGPGARDRAQLVDAVRPLAATLDVPDPDDLLVPAFRPAGGVSLHPTTSLWLDVSRLVPGLIQTGVDGENVVRATFELRSGVAGLDPSRAEAAIDRFLDPARWPELVPSRWDAMTPIDPPPADGAPGMPFEERRRYHEKFRVTSWLQLTPVLEFVRSRLRPGAVESGGVQVLEYRLLEGANDDDLVRRDSGALLAWFTDGVLRVRTTKRIRFRPPFDGPGLAMFAGVLGYLDAAQQMVLNAIPKTSPPGAKDVHAHR